MKQSADNNFKFDENSRKFLKWVDNTMGKGEIARYKQFFLYPHCFQKWVKPIQNLPVEGGNPFENIVGK